MNKYLRSSANPNNLSMTVGGMIVGSIPVIIFLASTQDVVLTENAIIDFVNRATFIISEVAIGVGLLRKLYYWLKRREERLIDKR
jgi:hypothetical protein